MNRVILSLIGIFIFVCANHFAFSESLFGTSQTKTPSSNLSPPQNTYSETVKSLATESEKRLKSQTSATIQSTKVPEKEYDTPIALPPPTSQYQSAPQTQRMTAPPPMPAQAVQPRAAVAKPKPSPAPKTQDSFNGFGASSGTSDVNSGSNSSSGNSGWNVNY